MIKLDGREVKVGDWLWCLLTGWVEEVEVVVGFLNLYLVDGVLSCGTHWKNKEKAYEGRGSATVATLEITTHPNDDVSVIVHK